MKNLKKALFHKKLKNNLVQCVLCPRLCTIKPGERGLCGVRQNVRGELYSLVYSRPCAMHVDPIEKKPLYHFLPGEMAFSIATVGCNFFCGFCQNWQISKADVQGIEENYEEVKPEKVVKLCRENECRIISYTYTEPTIFYEYMLDTARLARKQGLKNMMVSNGYIEEEPLRKLCKYLDAANIDLKAFTNDFYRKICRGKLEPVLNTLKILKQEGVWLEITNLVVPGLNDDFDKIEEMCKWIAKELGRDVPVHFTRFHPDYKMQDSEPTLMKTLEKAKEIAGKYLDYVYLGNIGGENNTLCPECKEVVVKRSFFRGCKNMLKKGKCRRCGKVIRGVWG